MATKPRIGMLALMLDEYNKSFPELKSNRAIFARKLVKELKPYADVDFLEVADTRKIVETQIRYFENKEFDGIIVVLLTYAPSLIASRGLIKTKLPVILWNTQEENRLPQNTPSTTILKNHGVHGIQDLANVLKREKKDFFVITGFYQDENTLKKVVNTLKAMKTKNVLENSRIGLLGYSMQNMGDFNIDETAFLNQVGPSVIHLSVEKLADLIEKAPLDAVDKIMKEDQKRFEWDDTITAEEKKACSCMEWAIRELIKKYDLNGWAQHFMSLGNNRRINMLPFLAASKLMSEGIGYGAEGDVTATTAFLLVQVLAGKANFTEMFSMDFVDGSVLIKHMGEGNIGFARENFPVRIIRNEFNMVEVMPIPSVVFSVKPGEATLVSLTTGSEGKFKLVVAEGEVTDFIGTDEAVSPEFKWRPRIPLDEFLSSYAQAGGSHHQAMGYGNLSRIIKKLGGMMDLKVIKIC